MTRSTRTSIAIASGVIVAVLAIAVGLLVARRHRWRPRRSRYRLVGICVPRILRLVWGVVFLRGIPYTCRATSLTVLGDANTTWKRFVPAAVNEMWQNHATHTELADGTEVDVVNIIDDHSRTCVRAHAVDGSTTGADAWEAFVRAVGTEGIPAWLLPDNGPPTVL